MPVGTIVEWDYTNDYSMYYNFNSTSTHVSASGEKHAYSSGTSSVSGTLLPNYPLLIIPSGTTITSSEQSGSFTRTPGIWSATDYYPEVMPHYSSLNNLNVYKVMDSNGKCHWGGYSGNPPHAPDEGITWTDGTHTYGMISEYPSYAGEGSFDQDTTVRQPLEVVVESISSLSGRLRGTYSYYRTASRNNANLTAHAEYNWVINFRIVLPQ